MKKYMLVVFLFSLRALATTYNITPTTPNSTVVSDLAAGSSGGNTYNFAAGTYTQATSTWTFPCVGGNVFKGPSQPFTIGTGIAPTAVFAPTFSGSNAVFITGDNSYTSAGAGCIVKYLGFKGQDVYVYVPVSGLLFEFNAIYDILGEISGGGCTTCWAGWTSVTAAPQKILDIRHSPGIHLGLLART
jgi:hypothetical protein